MKILKYFAHLFVFLERNTTTNLYAQCVWRRRRSNPHQLTKMWTFQQANRPCQSNLPSRVLEEHQPSACNGLWRVRARLPPGCVSVLLWTMGLYASWMHSHGYSKHHNQSLRVWLLHGRAYRWSTGLWYLYCWQTLQELWRIGESACSANIRLFNADTQTKNHSKKQNGAFEWASWLEYSRHLLLQGQTNRAEAYSSNVGWNKNNYCKLDFFCYTVLIKKIKRFYISIENYLNYV